MGLIEAAGGNAVWREMDCYDEKKVIDWEKTGCEQFDGTVVQYTRYIRTENIRADPHTASLLLRDTGWFAAL